jgi:hypothetical protein
MKPLARATRLQVLRRTGGTAIGRRLEEDLLRGADVMSEGACRPGDKGACYFGSTTIRVPMERLGAHWRGPFDARARRRLAHTLEGSARVRLRVMRLALREAERRVGPQGLGTARVEIRMQLVDSRLHIEVDLEAPLVVSSRAGRH